MTGQHPVNILGRGGSTGILEDFKSEEKDNLWFAPSPQKKTFPQKAKARVFAANASPTKIFLFNICKQNLTEGKIMREIAC